MNADVIPSDAPSVFDILKDLTTLERQAIVRPNDPPRGIGGFLFDIVGEDVFELSSEITDHYVENNTAINDQIANRPEQITIRGVVAELSDGRSAAQPLAPKANPLPINPEIYPELTVGAEQTQAASEATRVSAATAVASQQSLYGYFDAQSAQRPNQTKQSKAFLYFYALWQARQLFSVETPWGIMTNVGIATFRASQDETTKGASDFSLTVKKLRFAAELNITEGQLAGRAAQQAAPVTQNGNAGQTTPSPTQKSSILYKLANPGQ